MLLKMKFLCILVVVVSLTVTLVHSGDPPASDNKQNDKSNKDEKPTPREEKPLPKADNKTNNEKPRDNKKVDKVTNALCQSCECNSTTKSFDCSRMNLHKLFTMKDWLSLNESGIAVDIMRLGHNGIENVTVFPTFDVKILDLSFNQITIIAKQAFKDLNKLEELNLSHNKIESAMLTPDVFEGKYNPDEYEPLESLKKLSLASNNLHTLNADLFEHFPNLETLILESNVFRVIDQQTESALVSIAKLKVLDMSYMELNVLPPYVFHTPRSLTTLNLTGNLFSEVPEALSYAVNLKWLSLDENPIRNIVEGNAFPSMKKLEYLSLSYMTPLQVIGKGAFSGLENLNEIHICNNPHLTTVHDSAFTHSDPNNTVREDWPKVKKLYMHNNNISSIDSHLMARWDDMEVIDIRANPWSCDCENQWMIDTLLPIIQLLKPNTTNNIICSYPSQMAGVSLTNLKEKNTKMRCLDKFGNSPDKDAPLLIGLLIGVLAGIPLTLATILIYKRGCFGLAGHRGPADYSRAFYKRADNQDDMHI